MIGEEKWIYLAALIDGEGHISITRSDKPTYRTQRGKEKKYRCPVRYGVTVAISNTDIRLMKKLEEIFGACGSYNGTGKPLKNHPTWKPKYQWNVCGNEIKEQVLVAILPYLVLKSKQAETALEFLRLRDQKVPAKRQELYEINISLNKRGKLVETNTSCDSTEESMIESELIGNNESAPMVTLTA